MGEYSHWFLLKWDHGSAQPNCRYGLKLFCVSFWGFKALLARTVQVTGFQSEVHTVVWNVKGAPPTARESSLSAFCRSCEYHRKKSIRDIVSSVYKSLMFQLHLKKKIICSSVSFFLKRWLRQWLFLYSVSLFLFFFSLIPPSTCPQLLLLGCHLVTDVSEKLLGRWRCKPIHSELQNK